MKGNHGAMAPLPMAQAVPQGAGKFHLPSLDQPFVIGSIATVVGKVPQVTSKLTWQDKQGHYLARWNIGRDHLRVEPGLYALGQPTAASEVMVTANYKMSFDLLRQTMDGRDAWLLILDTKGINVWCAAGKGSFGTVEMVDRLQASRLAEVVNHRQLIVPQLGAPGLAAHEVKKYSGFRVIYGPVSLADLPRFLDNGGRVEPNMRRKNFPLRERLVLVPVELMQGLQQVLPIMTILLLVAGFTSATGFGIGVRSHGLPLALALVGGMVSGNVLTPLLLPWLPVRAFSVKGLLVGLPILGLLLGGLGYLGGDYGWLEQFSWFLLGLAVSSWLAMAFTGASTFTSLNGVRKEMLFALPLQFFAALGGLVFWGVAIWP